MKRFLFVGLAAGKSSTSEIVDGCHRLKNHIQYVESAFKEMVCTLLVVFFF